MPYRTPRKLLLLTVVAAICLLQAASAAASSYFEPTGSMSIRRGPAAAAPLPEGKVLLAGGQNGTYLTEYVDLASAEIYDPATGAWTATGSLQAARAGAVAAPLPDGRVLVAGGQYKGSALASAEIFDPATGTFSPTDSLGVARSGAAAAPLPDGRILVAGGWDDTLSEPLDSAEIFDPATGAFESTGIGAMVSARQGLTAAALADGRVLLIGGNSQNWEADTSEFFDPLTETFSQGPTMAAIRDRPSAATLPDGRVLVVGGVEGGESLETTEFFDPATSEFTDAGAPTMLAERFAAGVVPIGGGRLLVAGGAYYDHFHQISRETAELFLAEPEAIGAGIDFGEQPVGEPTGVREVTIANRGAQPLQFSAPATLAGNAATDFSIVVDSCWIKKTVEFGESCSIGVRATPSALGAREAELSVATNGAGPQDFPLSVTGVAPPLGPPPLGPAEPEASGSQSAPKGPAADPAAPAPQTQSKPSRPDAADAELGCQRKKKHRFACTLRFSTASNQAVHVSLARRAHTVAAGKPQLKNGSAILRFARSRPLPKGDYALAVRWGDGEEAWTTQSTVRFD